ncbi:4Fe-4S binding protein [uncultured Methanobrevibacter sp.]|uniref:4Fe-4S binding protein n=1 Tax=uncultured Methanobrevibacter sp. TaxID=253161 RepID=UPI0025D5BACC|nr:4Fe-4S binding protein [uncultured Methanobrevibacter sp.]
MKETSLKNSKFKGVFGACEGTCPTSAIEVTPNSIIHCDTCGEEPKCADACPNGALKVEEFEVVDGVMQARLVFNSVLCDSCGKCEEVCPQETIKVTGAKLKEVEGFCVMCQKCVDICPVDVIGIPGVKEPAEYDLDLKGKGPVYIKDCVGCGTCVEPCPVSAITLEEVGSPITVNDDCIRCGLCSQTCPWNAIFISEKKPVKRSKEITSFTFDSAKCIGCNTCVEACPGDFISANSASLTVAIPSVCAACGLCVKVCPVDALDIEIEWGEGAPVDAEGIGRDVEKCDFIGACANKCPTEAIRVVTKTGMSCPALVETDSEPSFTSCIRCGACASVCSNDALKVDQYEVTIDGEPVIRDRISFNPSKCDQCGDCIEACPYDMIHKTDNPKLPIAGFCTLCGQCIEACPEDALCYK